MDFDVNKRLISFLEAIRYSQTDFATRIGVKQQQVNYWVKLNEQVPDRQVVRIVQKFPEINANWFIRGEGNMFEQNSYFKTEQITSPEISTPPHKCKLCEAKDDQIFYMKMLIETQKNQIETQGERRRGSPGESSGGVEMPGKTG